MTSEPSSTRIPAPRVLEIDRSKYPFSSPLFEPETTDGLWIQFFLDKAMGWSKRSELSYFEVVDGKGDLYEHLDVGDDAVADFVYDTQRSPQIRIFFIEIDSSNWRSPYLTKERFIELLEKTGVPPTFIEAFTSVTGASIGSPVYSDGDQEKAIAYQLLVTFSNNIFFNAAFYFRYDFSTCRTTCLVFEKHLSGIQKRFQQVFPGDLSTGTGLPQQYHRDPFLVLSIIAAEYVSAMRAKNAEIAAMFGEECKQTGIIRHLCDRSLRVSLSAMPSRIKGLHICNLQLGYFINTSETKISFVAFLQRQHRIFNEIQTKLMIDGADLNRTRRMKDESIASQKVSFSLDLSASLLHNLLYDVRALSRDVETNISIVQSMISQFDSRTDISIAHDLKKDSVAMKTVAGLTMVFLPGTFTATFFSMVFFHVTDDPEPRLTVNKHWWLYVAVAVPLTVLVLAAWLGWLRWKRRGMRGDAELEISGEKKDERDTSVESLRTGNLSLSSSSSG